MMTRTNDWNNNAENLKIWFDNEYALKILYKEKKNSYILFIVRRFAHLWLIIFG